LLVLCLVAASIAMAHAALYAWTTPPWHLFDEEQHVDYTLSLRDRRLPEISDDIHQGIVDDAVATQRWATFHLPQPRSTRVEDLGLEGRSYEAYQPPLYYALGVLAILPAGHDAGRALALLRGLSVVLAGAVAALVVIVTWLALGAPDRPPIGVAAGGILVALLPSFAQAGGRASNDIAVAAAVVATAAASLAWTRSGTTRLTVLTAVAATAACLTKSSGLVVLAIVVLAAIRVRRGAIVAVGVPLATAAGWAAVTWARYGVLEGSRAFIEYAHFRPHSWTLLTRSARPAVVGTTLLMESQRTGANAWTLTVCGLALPLAAIGAWRARPLGRAIVLVIVAGSVGVTVTAFAEGLEVGVMSRLVLPAVAVIASLVGVGVGAGAGAHRRAMSVPALAVTVASAAMALWYFAHL
jgi:hypothetical protein